MARVRTFGPVKLFTGVLASDPALFSSVKTVLQERYGPVDLESDVIPFTFTNYYENEMGPAICRKFYSFAQLIDAESLAKIKIETNALEQLFAATSAPIARPVNLDPGYVENAKVLLASTKNFYHRIYLGSGIFAEVTLHFRGKGFLFFPWTYQDYRTEPYLAFFAQARGRYLEQTKAIGPIGRIRPISPISPEGATP